MGHILRFAAMPQLDFDISAALTAETQSAFEAAIKALEALAGRMAGGPATAFHPAGKKADDLPDLRDMAVDMAVALPRDCFRNRRVALRTGAGTNSMAGELLPGQSRGPQLISRIIWTPPAWRNF
ncbi:MAG: hypothetical protein CM15mP55_0940 [Hyphomicrobiales bacterium]|nr:MAG: hypothetical protein CM15mP55_0940 [Hyphomicrobiales bacterium]